MYTADRYSSGLGPQPVNFYIGDKRCLRMLPEFPKIFSICRWPCCLYSRPWSASSTTPAPTVYLKFRNLEYQAQPFFLRLENTYNCIHPTSKANTASQFIDKQLANYERDHSNVPWPNIQLQTYLVCTHHTSYPWNNAVYVEWTSLNHSLVKTEKPIEQHFFVYIRRTYQINTRLRLYRLRICKEQHSQ